MAETKTKFDPFWTAGQAHMKAAQATLSAKSEDKTARVSFPTISPGMAEWEAWEVYFLSRYGSCPAAMEDARRKIIPSFTVPEQWPEDFDLSYVAPAKRPALPDRRRPDLVWPPLPPGRVYYWELNGQRPIGRFEKVAPEVRNAAPRPREQPRSLEASPALIAHLKPKTEDAA